MTGGEVEPREANPLERLEQARAYLEQSRDLPEVKNIRDVALAAKEYARAQKMGAEAQQYAQEIANRAERRLGQLLAGTPKDQGRRTDKLGTGPVPSPRQQVGKKLSARSQAIAALDDDTFDKNVTLPTSRLRRMAVAQARRARQREAADLAQAPRPGLCDLWTSQRKLLLREAGRAERTLNKLQLDHVRQYVTSASPSCAWDVFRDDADPEADPMTGDVKRAVAEARAIADEVRREAAERVDELAAWLADQAARVSGPLRRAAENAPDDPDILIGRAEGNGWWGDAAYWGTPHWRLPHEPEGCDCWDRRPGEPWIRRGPDHSRRST